MTSADRIRARLLEELPAAVALRHRLHADPCLSGAEGPTTATVVAALDWGEGVRVAETGRLVGASRGAVVLRAELDALPVTEATGVPWTATGATMHACGHDVHLAAAVAAGRAITGVHPDVPVGVLFQPREEASPSGARDVVESELLETFAVRAVIGAHVQPQLPAGTVAVTPGLVNASVDEFEIVVHGHGGHAGYPHTVRDPIVALAAVVVALQQLASRRIDPVHGAVCTIGRLAGGTAANVVPATASALGTLRLLHRTDRDPMMRALEQVARFTAQAWGCTAQVEFRAGEPAVLNDPTLATRAARHLARAGIPVDVTWRSFGADDFSYYGADRPALMAFVGVDGGAGLHEPAFVPPNHTVGLVAETLVAGYLAAVEPVEPVA